jgi:2',3'-cyclic-nucleotide 2'-phosphodiesterase (5'-nucleotidase family)
MLRDEYGCDLIIALNHMHLQEDINMAEFCKNDIFIDMIFGGHDHVYFSQLNQSTNVFI